MALGSNGLLTDSARGSEPAAWRHSVMTPAVTFTWHHTIPWNCLAAVWNGLVAGQHWDAVQSFLQLVSAQDPRGIVRQIQSGKLMNRDMLHTQLTWQGWNIVEGPGNEFRAGDPGEAYDAWSTIHGVSGSQRGTIHAVNLLYTVMRPLALRPARPGFTGQVPNISAAEARQLARLMSSQTGNLRGRSPMLWNGEAWAVVQEGKIDRRFPGRWQVKPVWRKKA